MEPSEPGLQGPTQRADAAPAGNEMDRVKCVRELGAAGLFLAADDRRDERQPVVSTQPREQLAGDELGALGDRNRRRPVDDEDVQGHARTLTTLARTQARWRARAGRRSTFTSTARSQYTRSAVVTSSPSKTAGPSPSTAPAPSAARSSAVQAAPPRRSATSSPSGRRSTS